MKSSANLVTIAWPWFLDSLQMSNNVALFEDKRIHKARDGGMIHFQTLNIYELYFIYPYFTIRFHSFVHFAQFTFEHLWCSICKYETYGAEQRAVAAGASSNFLSFISILCASFWYLTKQTTRQIDRQTYKQTDRQRWHNKAEWKPNANATETNNNKISSV